MVEVILLERVEKLGLLGQVVNVRPGFARNFLLPQKKALRATKANLALFEERRAQLEANNLAMRGEAEIVAGRMSGLSIIVVRQAGESGLLYGSVSARDISDGIVAGGFTVERRQIALDHPMRPSTPRKKTTHSAASGGGGTPSSPDRMMPFWPQRHGHDMLAAHLC